MPAIDPVEVAHGLMFDAARNVTEWQVRNELCDFPGIDDLSGAELKALVAQVLDEIRTAGIAIEPGAAVSRAWLFWVGDVLVDVAEYPEPVSQWHAQVRYAADRDMPPATAEPVPDGKLPAIRALYDHTDGGRRITRDDVKGILS